MCYYAIETVQDRLLRRQISKIVVTLIQYIIHWDFRRKTKVAMGDPYINYYYDMTFGVTIRHQKANDQVPRVFIRIRVLYATKKIYPIFQRHFGQILSQVHYSLQQLPHNFVGRQGLKFMYPSFRGTF